MPKPKLYVGCSLTQAPEAFKTSVEQLKAALREHGFEVFDFVGLTAGTPADVYRYDVGRCVGGCDAFIAICDYPSIGLGWELATAVQLGKPILAVAHEGAQVTRLVLGAAEIEPDMRFERYRDLVADVARLAAELPIGENTSN